MNDWEKVTSQILKYVTEMEVENERQYIIKLSIAVNLYRMLFSEEIYNDTMDVLNKKL